MLHNDRARSGVNDQESTRTPADRAGVFWACISAKGRIERSQRRGGAGPSPRKMRKAPVSEKACQGDGGSNPSPSANRLRTWQNRQPFGRSQLMSVRPTIATLALVLVAIAASTPARAQDVMNKDSAAAVKASFLADLATLRGKFVALAQPFPQAN